METATLVITIVVAAVGATWVIASRLTDIQLAFRDHVATDEARFTKLEKLKVVSINSRGKKRS